MNAIVYDVEIARCIPDRRDLLADQRRWLRGQREEEKVSERPILFSDAMVRAILEGRKTQTRRVVRGRVGKWLAPGVVSPHVVAHPSNGMCPYGGVGDRLWVREVWNLYRYAPVYDPDAEGPSGELAADPEAVIPRERPDAAQCLMVLYRASTESPRELQWRSPIHMPRWASRLTLEITDVRMERVQAITEADAIAEGASQRTSGWSMDWERVGMLSRYAAASPVKGRDLAPLSEDDIALATPRLAFAQLWNHLNASRGYAWEHNPWVWVIEFRPVTRRTEGAA